MTTHITTAPILKLSKIIAALAVASCATSFATSMTWRDQDPSGDILNSFGDQISGRLSIVSADGDSFSETAGYRPGIDTLNIARIAWHFDGVTRDVDWPIAGWRLDAFTTVSTTWEVIPGVPVEFKAWGPLTGLGHLDFTITYKGQETTPLTLTYADLSVLGQQQQSRVPDGGATAMLLGAGITGLAFFARRRCGN